MRRPWLAVLAPALLPAAPAAGTTLKYIAGAPALTVEVPAGWTAQEERYHIVHPLEFRPKKGTVPYRVQMFYFPLGDEDGPRPFVRELAAQQAQDDKLTNPTYEPPTERISAQKITMTKQVLRGRLGGVDRGYVFYYFVVQKHGYVLAVNGADATLPQAAEVAGSIIDSVRPLKDK